MSPENTDITAELQRLVAQQTDMQQRIVQAPERLRPTFEIAATAARAALHEYVETPSVQEAVSAQRTQQDSDVALIQDLFNRNLLTEDDAKIEMERIFRHPDYALLRTVIRIGGVSLADVEKPEATAPAEVETTAATPTLVNEPKPAAKQAEPATQADDKKPQTSRPRKDRVKPRGNFTAPRPENAEGDAKTVKVTIDENTLTVNGVTYAADFYQGNFPRHIALLRTIAQLTPGEEISAQVLLQRAFPGEQRSKDVRKISKQWLIKTLVTKAGDHPILLHNHKRGNGSRYIRNPDVNMDVVDLTAVKELNAGEEITEFENVHELPTLSERKLMCLLIDEIARDSGDTFAFETAAKEENVDFSRLTPEQASQLLATSLSKLKTYATNPSARESLLTLAIEKEDNRLFTFLETIEPRLSRYVKKFPTDRKLRALAEKVMTRVRVPRRQRDTSS